MQLPTTNDISGLVHFGAFVLRFKKKEEGLKKECIGLLLIYVSRTFPHIFLCTGRKVKFGRYMETAHEWLAAQEPFCGC